MNWKKTEKTLKKNEGKNILQEPSCGYNHKHMHHTNMDWKLIIDFVKQNKVKLKSIPQNM